MKITWILFSLLVGSVVRWVSCGGGVCDTTHVEQCFKNIVNFERQGFPLYGKDEEELDETCEMVSESFECIQGYWQQCNEKNKACNDECMKMQVHIKNLSQNTGLRSVAEDLCNPGTTRDAYFENYSCFERNSESYAACHDRSKMSQDCSESGSDNNELLSQAMTDQCCFINWYIDCFTNATRNTCNENATNLVSSLLQTFLTQISEKVCADEDTSEGHTLHEEDIHSEEMTQDAPNDEEHVMTTTEDYDRISEESYKSYAVILIISSWTPCLVLLHLAVYLI